MNKNQKDKNVDIMFLDVSPKVSIVISFVEIGSVNITNN